MSWVFQTSDPMGGAAGEAYANTLKSSGIPHEHVLAREAIQNSVDAQDPDKKKALVRFRATTLMGNSKAAFVKASALTDLADRIDALRLNEPNCLKSLSDGKKPLQLLYVDDYNTIGLRGRPHDSESHFYRLLLSLGDRSKSRIAGHSGGSYGFGKSVYSASSAIQTIVAYTRCADDESKPTALRSRLFGCGYYATHTHEKKRYSGRAWLGTPQETDNEGRPIVDPVWDEEADALACLLGFDIRDDDKPGTSILIVDSALDLAQISVGVEDWWWPRLIEQDLDVEIIPAAGGPIIPRPRKRPDLVPFIEAYEVAVERSQPLKGQQRRQRLNALESTPLGDLGLNVVAVRDDKPVVTEGRTNTVALIRSPRMVVAYHQVSTATPIIVGAYVATHDIDGTLRLAEPPAHDKWDPNSGNLHDITGDQRRVVQAVLNRIQGNFKRFQSEAAPPPPPKERKLSYLERALGAYFGGGSGSGPNPTTTPFHIGFIDPPHAIAVADTRLKVESEFEIRLDDEDERESLSVKLHVACPVLEDNGHEGDDLSVTIEPQRTKVERDHEEPATVCFKLQKGKAARFKVASEAYDAAWTVRLRPEVESVENES